MRDALLPMLNPARLFRAMARDALQARGAGKPPPCRCGAEFTSFRARKEHIRACSVRPAQGKE